MICGTYTYIETLLDGATRFSRQLTRQNFRFDEVLNTVIAKLRHFRFSIELDENICYSFNAYIIIANVRIGYFVRVGNNVR